MQRVITIFLLIIVFFKVEGQDLDTVQKRIKVLPFPTLGYEPETRFHFGAVALFTLNFYADSTTRTSNAKIEFNYTLRNQIILESEWDYFFRDERWFTQGLMHFSRYPDYYYGVGANSSLENELLFETNRIDIEAGLFRSIGNKLFLGGGIRILNYSSVKSDSIINFDELKDRENYGLSSSFFYDNRNNLLNTSSGSYLRSDIEYNLSRSNYFRLRFDARKYVTLKYGFIVAGRLYNQFTIGEPTFYDYAVLGGDDYVRGYFFGRYRDKHLSTLQTEIRTPYLWRLSLAVISGISTLYDQPSRFTKTVRPNYGLGLRFLVDKKDKVNLRFDYVLGNDQNSGFYISFGESF